MSEIYLPGESKNLGILLLHAYTGSPLDMNLLGRHLHQEGYGVSIPTFSGHDTADVWDILHQTPSQWWQDTLAAYEDLAEKYERVMVFGLSMGGIFATKLLEEAPEQLVAGGVINSPVVSREVLDVADAFERYAATSYQKMGKDFTQEADEVLNAHRKQMLELQVFTKALTNHLSNIACPFYMAQSGQDELIDPESSYDFQDALENAHIEFHWFPENTHVITINDDRQDFENSLDHFIHAHNNDAEYYKLY